MNCGEWVFRRLRKSTRKPGTAARTKEKPGKFLWPRVPLREARLFLWMENPRKAHFRTDVLASGLLPLPPRFPVRVAGKGLSGEIFTAGSGNSVVWGLQPPGGS